jgi:hypothetical protein
LFVKYWTVFGLVLPTSIFREWEKKTLIGGLFAPNKNGGMEIKDLSMYGRAPMLRGFIGTKLKDLGRA